MSKPQNNCSGREGKNGKQNKDGSRTLSRSIYNRVGPESRGPCFVPDDS